MIHITVEGRSLQPRTIHSGTPLCAAEGSNNMAAWPVWRAARRGRADGWAVRAWRRLVHGWSCEVYQMYT